MGSVGRGAVAEQDGDVGSCHRDGCLLANWSVASADHKLGALRSSSKVSITPHRTVGASTKFINPWVA